MYINARVGNDSLTALVDTGASGFAFISKKICESLCLNPIALKSSVALVGFEGKRSSLVTHQVHFSLIIGRHVEELYAFVIDSCKTDLILGLPWLEKHNPYVDWEDHTITFGEPCLKNRCCLFETSIPYINSPACSKRSLSKMPLPSNNHQGLPVASLSFPIEASACDFALMSRQEGNTMFAFSLKDLDLLLDDSM